MAITISPTLFTINSFDAAQNKIIYFSMEGINAVPSQVVVTIKDNLTNEEVYKNTTTISLGNLSHTIVANSLSNNLYYTCFINIIDKDGNISPNSNSVSFYCIQTPIFRFTNIVPIINTSEFTVNLEYEQLSSVYDPLISYNIILYNSQNIKVFETNTVYVNNINNISVKIENIEEDNYRIIAQGETLNKLIISTEETFSVSYNAPTSYSSMFLENLFDKGQIKLTSNIVALEGTLVGDYEYIDDKMLDLSKDNTYVLFDRGFVIKDDFYLKIWMKNINANSKKYFLQLFQNNTTIECYWRYSSFKETDNQPKYFIELIVNQNNLKYTIHSNYLDNIDDVNDVIFIGIKKINNLYKVVISKSSVRE